MGKLILLALAAAFYPTLLAIVILILTRPQPVRLLTAFYVGAVLWLGALVARQQERLQRRLRQANGA